MSSEGNFNSSIRKNSKKNSSSGSIQTRAKSSSSKGLRNNESTEFVLFNESFNTSDFSRRGSLISSQSAAASTSGVFYGNLLKTGKNSGETVSRDHSSLLHSLGSDKSKLSRGSKNKSQSKDSMQKPTEHLFLKKTDETIHFSFANTESDLMDSENTHCEAGILRLGDERQSSEVTTRSDLFTESLFREINVDSHGDDLLSFENKSQSSVPFQKCENVDRESDELAPEKKKEKKSFNLWSKSYHLSKPQVMAFFNRRRKNKKERFDPEEIMEVRFLDPPVPYDEEIRTRAHIRNCYFHALQLMVFTCIALSMVTSEMFYFTDTTAKLFFDTVYDNSTYDDPTNQKTLRESRTIDDFWTYAENTMIKLLYWDFFYYKNDKTLNADQDENKMFNENQILGVARIRQVRVKKNSCKIHPQVKRFFDSCYDYYSVFSEDTKPIKKDMKGTDTETAWVFSEAKSLHSAPYWGAISIYGGGGYYVDLPSDKDGARKIITELKENQWVTRATRAIFVEFNIYNANINLFCICKIVIELPPGGGIIPLADFHSLKLIRYLTTFDFFILGCELVYVLFVLNSTWQIIRAIRKQRNDFLKNGWNYLNVLILTLSYTSAIVNVIRYIYSVEVVKKLNYNDNEYIEFDVLKNIQIAFNNIVAVLLFLSWVKLFSFLNFTKSMQEFRKVIHLSFLNMVSFLPVFLTLFFSFVFLSHLLFGGQVKNFESILSSFQTLLYAFLEGLNYSEIYEADKLLGPIFFLSFVFFVLFVLANVFFAIVNSAYLSVKMQVIPDRPRTGDFVRRGLTNVFTCCKPRRVKGCLKRSWRKKLLFEDIKTALKRAGFTREEIIIFFEKYGINTRNFLEDETKTRLMKDLELKRIEYTETTEQFQINLLRRRFDALRDKMENWEGNLQPVIDKVDVLLHRL